MEVITPAHASFWTCTLTVFTVGPDEAIRTRAVVENKMIIARGSILTRVGCTFVCKKNNIAFYINSVTPRKLSGKSMLLL